MTNAIVPDQAQAADAVHVQAAVPEGFARAFVTYNGETGDLPDPISLDTPHDEVRRMVQEALRTGGVRGLAAIPEADLHDFIVDPIRPNEVTPFPRLALRPKTNFGHGGMGNDCDHGHHDHKAADEVKTETKVPDPERRRILGGKFEPGEWRVMLERVDPKEMTRGGIIIPDMAKEKPEEAIVLAIGPGKFHPDGTTQHPRWKVGDRVLFGRYSGHEVKIDGQTVVIVNHDDILGRLT